MKKEIVLHIGYPKTGTTTLQKHFFPNVSEFNYLGKDYKLPNHYNFDKKIIHNLLVNADADLFMENQEISTFFYNYIENKALLSEESFLYNSIRPNIRENKTSALPFSILHYAQVLRNVFPEEKFDIKILMTIRRQDEMILSLYAQSFTHFYSKYFETNTFFKFVNFFIDSGVNHYNQVLDYKHVIDVYANLFGEKAICILVYEELKQNPLEFYSKLRGYLNVDRNRFPEFSIDKIENKRNIDDKFKQTRNYTLLDLIKATKFTRIKSSPVFKKKIKGFLMRINLPRTNINQSIYLTDNQRLSIMKKYEESNKYIDTVYKLRLTEFDYFPDKLI